MGRLRQGPHPAGCMESQDPRLLASWAADVVGSAQLNPPGQHQPRERWQGCLSHRDSQPGEPPALRGSARAISGLLSPAHAANKALGLHMDWCWEKPFIAFEILL